MGWSTDIKEKVFNKTNGRCACCGARLYLYERYGEMPSIAEVMQRSGHTRVEYETYESFGSIKEYELTTWVFSDYDWQYSWRAYCALRDYFSKDDTFINPPYAEPLSSDTLKNIKELLLLDGFDYDEADAYLSDSNRAISVDSIYNNDIEEETENETDEFWFGLRPESKNGIDYWYWNSELCSSYPGVYKRTDKVLEDYKYSILRFIDSYYDEGYYDTYQLGLLDSYKYRYMTIDHFIPKSRGGTNDISNLFPLCKPCNSAKADRRYDSPYEIYKYLL